MADRGRAGRASEGPRGTQRELDALRELGATAADVTDLATRVTTAEADVAALEKAMPQSTLYHQDAAFNTGFGSLTTGKALYAQSGVLVAPTAQALAFDIFLFDPTLHESPTGVLEWNLQATCWSNATSPAITATFGVYPVNTSAGGAGVITVTVGTVLAGSTVALGMVANEEEHGQSGWFDAPASAEFYCLGAVGSGTQAANSAFISTVQLFMRNGS